MCVEIKKEIWKDVNEFPNYQVSNLGNVRNKKTGHVLSPQINNRTGYYHVHIAGSDKTKNVYVHKLVSNSFLGERPSGYDVNHIDGNKLNNTVDNLEYCSRSSNVKHAYKNGLNTQVVPVMIEETGKVYDTINDCARDIDGDAELIRQCINPKYSRNTHKGYHFIPVKEYSTGREAMPIRILETGEIFNSVRECERAINGAHTNILWAIKNNKSYKGLHFEFLDNKKNNKKQPFLYPHQKDAITRMFNGSILNGGTGSGKSRTGIYYFFQKNGGSIDDEGNYTPMRQNPKPPDLYIITTAKKRNDMEFEQELAPFLLSTEPKHNMFYGNKVIIDSWQNIKKYADVTNAQFIFDEDKVTGNGVWAKSFLKIAKNNEWIILSATPADKWPDFEAVFIANGFFKNRTEMRNEHYNYSRFTNFPQITSYRNEGRLIRLRDKILIDMDFDRHTTQLHEDVYVQYDLKKYRDAMRNRWDPYNNKPIEQASGLCYVLRRIVNEDESRQVKLLELLEDHPKAIVFYNFDHELDILMKLGYSEGTKVAQYNGHKHEVIPEGDKWVYLVNYNAGSEGFNCIKTDTIIFYSQNYSYKIMTQATGRIDRLNTPFKELHYYHLKSRSNIDLAISKALAQKKKFNERKFVQWD